MSEKQGHNELEGNPSRHESENCFLSQVSKCNIKQWEKRMMQGNPDEDAAKSVMMDFMVKRNMKDAAAAFTREAQIKVRIQETMSIERNIIKSAILDGRAADAIEAIKNMCPQILEEEKRLIFYLKQMHFTNFVRTHQYNQYNEAVEYATKELAELTVEFPELRKSFEYSMGLLVIPSPEKGSPLARFYSSEHRALVANSVNDAILKTLGIEPSTTLHKLQHFVKSHQSQFAPMSEDN